MVDKQFVKELITCARVWWCREHEEEISDAEAVFYYFMDVLPRISEELKECAPDYEFPPRIVSYRFEYNGEVYGVRGNSEEECRETFEILMKELQTNSPGAVIPG